MATARRQPLSDIVAAAVNSPRVRPKSGKLARRGPPPALVLEPELEQLDEQGGQDESGLALLMIADRRDGYEDDGGRALLAATLPSPPRCCAQCGSDDSQAQILMCEGCGGAYHMDCVSPPLSTAPPGGFYCRRSLCRRKSGATKRLSTMHSTRSPISDELESPLHSTDRLRPPRRAVAWEELAPSRRYAPDAHTKVSQRALQSAPVI